MKSQKMEQQLNQFAKQAFGRERRNGECVSCGAEVNVDTDFRDALSLREYRISFMCQKCQDSVFGVDE